MQLFFQDQPRKERGRREKKEREKTSMDSDGKQGGGQDASTADRLRPLSMVWEH